MAETQARVSIPAELRWDREVQKSIHESLPYYVPGFLSAAFSERGIDIVYAGEGASEVVADAVRDLVVRTARGYRDVAERSLGVSDGLLTLVEYDPFTRLLDRREVVPTGRGKFVYAGDFLRVFAGLDRLLEDYSVSAGAKRELYPSTVETQTLIASGYLSLYPHLAYFVAPGHLDKASLMELGRPEVLDPVNRPTSVSHLGPPAQVLAPTVCYHCFEARRSRELGPSLITAVNKCHRHELVNVVSLERLTTYWMRELIVFGDIAFVEQNLDDGLAFTTDLLDRWGIWYEVTAASDPFFADGGFSNRLFQTAFELKRELRLPSFSGKSMAVASFNNHQKSLVDKFAIEGASASGCIGWGFERFIYGLYCQLGDDVAGWPQQVIKDLGL